MNWDLFRTQNFLLLPSLELNVFLFFQRSEITYHIGIINLCSIWHLIFWNKKRVLIPVIYSFLGRDLPTPCARWPNSLESSLFHVVLSGPAIE